MFTYLKDVAEYLTPVLTVSGFQDRGVLTPDEFVSAGDQLVNSCRTWEWSGGSPSLQKAYLPHNKQFLITRKVPCRKRCQEYSMATQREMEDENGWTKTHNDHDDDNGEGKNNNLTIEDDIQEMKISEQKEGKSNSHSSSSSSSPSSLPLSSHPINHSSPSTAADDEDIPDIDSFTEDNLVDEGELRPNNNNNNNNNNLSSSSSPPLLGGSTYLRATEPDHDGNSNSNILSTRTYDISIVYDKYYRTPRVYLFGYDENRNPLTTNQIMEDISADHAMKTVTVEGHPHLGVQHASIHPCKHAAVMKKLVEQMTPAGTSTSSSSSSSSSSSPSADKFDVNQYMFIFLKFISSVIPTVEYDFTMQ